MKTTLALTVTLGVSLYFLVWSKNRWTTLRWSYKRRINNTESRKFLQLMKLSMDISTEVLRKVVNSRILSRPIYGGCILKFLDVEKHYLFHQWQGTISCNECPPTGCNLNKSRQLKGWLFKIFYKDNGNQQKGHAMYRNNRISQYCLHLFVTDSSLKVDRLDITGLSFLIEHFASLSPQENSAFYDIVTIRNSICHAWKTNCLNSTELENMWTKVSEASLVLTDLPSKNLLKDQIDMVKKVEFDNNDIEILRNKVEREEKMLEEICTFINQNCATNECVKETEKVIVSCIDSVRICVEDEVTALKEGQTILAKNLDYKLGVVLQHIDNLKSEIHLYVGTKPLIEHDEASGLTGRSIAAVCRIDDDNIDEKLVVENIMKTSKTDDKQENIIISSAKQSCIILNLACSHEVLKDEQSLKFALQTLLSNIVQSGNIDTHSPSSIIIKLIFYSLLTDKELSVINKLVEQTSTDDLQNLTLNGKHTVEALSAQDGQDEFEVYKITSLTSPVLEKKHDRGIIILTEESYIPEESNIEVRLWDDNTYYVMPAKMINSVVEFNIPWHNLPFCALEKLDVSVYDKKRKTDSSKKTITLSDRIENTNFAKTQRHFLPERNLSPLFNKSRDRQKRKSDESGFGSDKDAD
ncbi:Hypothetical predicted protein [Mytilus galloprovincialis]|nr:Hypothetical predicted protein [Mytilus galloprovincialis]